MRVPGHMVQTYHVTQPEETTNSPTQKAAAPLPSVIAPSPTTPLQPFVDPAIVNSPVQTQQHNLVPQKQPSPKQAQGKPSKGKKGKTHDEGKSKPRKTVKSKNTSDGTDGSTPQASPKSNKRGSKRLSQPRHIATPSPAVNDLMLEQDTKPAKKSTPAPRPKPMPQFGISSPQPRNVVESVDYEDYTDFIGMSDQGTKKRHSDKPKKTAELHKPDDPVNQTATQTLLSSLNMVGISSASPASPPGPASQHSPLMSATIASSGSASPMEHHHRYMMDTTPNSGLQSPSPVPAFDPSRRPSNPIDGDDDDDDEVPPPAFSRKKSIDVANIHVPLSLIPPKLRARSQLSQIVTHSSPPPTDALAAAPTKTNGHAITPTRTMVPIIDDDDDQNDSDNRSHSLHLVHHEHTVVLEEQPTNEQHLQKPMDDEEDQDDEPVPHGGATIKSVTTGKPCPVLSPEQLDQLMTIAKTEFGLTDVMMIENGAHAAASIVFKMLGGQRRIKVNNHNEAPTVVVFAGNHSVGSFGIATARHLANRGVQVLVLLIANEAQLSPTIIEQKRCAELSDAKFIQSIDDLPDPLTAPVDLIIDGMMSSTAKLDDLRRDHNVRTLLWQAIDWSNNNKAPILSLDFPSGVNGKDGKSR
ncbi:hypothetical protein DM01DRAFT_1335327 [Hesseltinella vesiculosa]|uniref:YjeF N-terminal domain-containing protein n=1 Tax=Hesseltinella vesiculosa TaxID=101127 RepID=A0A1X2GJ57_9FUNG|nr:hypothetical protein DM01DRAFT_1335327 [Hesseltinella vesiculosa]